MGKLKNQDIDTAFSVSTILEHELDKRKHDPKLRNCLDFPKLPKKQSQGCRMKRAPMYLATTMEVGVPAQGCLLPNHHPGSTAAQGTDGLMALTSKDIIITFRNHGNPTGISGTFFL